MGTNGVANALNFPKIWTAGATDILDVASLGDPTFTGTLRSAKLSSTGSFDVLGSGPVNPGESFEAVGAFGHKYPRQSLEKEFQIRREQMLAELESSRMFLDDNSDATAQQIETLQHSSYSPIDWHTDVKSGYRWNPGGWWLDQQIGAAPGVDVKVPWEISRGHHLVDIAIALNVNPGKSDASIIGLQILDWIIANPARTGVNWRSTMDVAIRASNWIWALAVAEMAAPASPSIIWIAARSLAQHAEFITKYPDSGGSGANNHYIADMAGLAHIAAALPSHSDAEIWGHTAASGLSQQANLAVNPDGFSYEGSVGYHRLITELLTHGTLATMRFPEKWPASQVIKQSSHWRILSRMFAAVKTLKKTNGRSPQFGDHDAGRFLKFQTPLRPASTEDPLDHSHLEPFMEGIASARLDSTGETHAEAILPVLGIEESRLSAARQAIESASNTVKHTPDPGHAWVAEASRFWVAVQTFNAEQSAPTGHLHDDALTVELCIDGQDILVDPGTGVYTADLDVRFRMRERDQHSTAGPKGVVGAHSNPFTLSNLGAVNIEHTSRNSLSATYETDNWSLNRRVNFTDSTFEITDTFAGDYPWQQVFIFHPDVSVTKTELDSNATVSISWSGSEITLACGNEVISVQIDEAMYSPNYGTVVPTKRLTIEHTAASKNTVSFEV
jgi:hypothetical protein